MLVLLAAAMPVRVPLSLGPVNSVSVLDLLLIAAAASVYFRTALVHRLDSGDPRLLLLLTLPLGASTLSLLWSQDPAATVRSSLIYLEGLLAYLFVVQETRDLAPGQVLTYMRRFVYLLIVPGMLLLLHVPGFGPQEAGLSPSSGDYISYYTRLSHPVLGRSNNLATLLAFFVPPLLYWGARHRDARCTWAGLAALVGVVLTLSRGVILALVVAGLLYWLTRPQHQTERASPGRSTIRTALGVAVILAAVILLYLLNPTTNEFIADRVSTTNIETRWQLDSLALSKLIQSPLLGYGGGVAVELEAGLALGVHNTYLQQALYYGVPLGLVVCMSLLQLCILFFSSKVRQDLGRVLGFSVLIQLLIFVFESSFEGTVLKVLFYLSLGLALGLLRSAENGSDAARASARRAVQNPMRSMLGRTPSPVQPEGRVSQIRWDQ
jgi:hypothetical protein